MRKLLVHEFMSLDGVMQAPGGEDEDRDGGFKYGGWTRDYWHDDIGMTFGQLMQDVDAFLLGRKTYVTHAQAFEPMPAGDPFGDMMNAPKKYVVSKTLEEPIWRNTTIIRDNVIGAVRALKNEPGKTIVLDGSAGRLFSSGRAGERAGGGGGRGRARAGDRAGWWARWGFAGQAVAILTTVQFRGSIDHG